jgi:hypothetical protein
MDKTISNNSQNNEEIKTKTPNKPYQCEICGAITTYFNKARHLRTKRHNDMLYIHHNKFDIK